MASNPTPARASSQHGSLFKKIALQVGTAVLAALVAEFIDYKVHPLNEVNTVGSALIVAFAFFPGILLGYFAVYILKKGGDEDPAPPGAALICALLWLVYLFRALTLLIHAPILSNWTQGPVNLVVKILRFFE